MMTSESQKSTGIPTKAHAGGPTSRKQGVWYLLLEAVKKRVKMAFKRGFQLAVEDV
jgi:hypothetical protein